MKLMGQIQLLHMQLEGEREHLRREAKRQELLKNNSGSRGAEQERPDYRPLLEGKLAGEAARAEVLRQLEDERAKEAALKAQRGREEGLHRYFGHTNGRCNTAVPGAGETSDADRGNNRP